MNSRGESLASTSWPEGSAEGRAARGVRPTEAPQTLGTDAHVHHRGGEAERHWFHRDNTGQPQSTRGLLLNRGASQGSALWAAWRLPLSSEQPRPPVSRWRLDGRPAARKPLGGALGGDQVPEGHTKSPNLVLKKGVHTRFLHSHYFWNPGYDRACWGS